MTPPPPSPISVVVPVYNEARGVAAVLRRLTEILSAQPERGWEIVAVDDGSQDGSAETISETPNVRLARHSENRGYGASLKTGIDRAQHPFILIIDADGTYPVESIPALLAAFDTEDGPDMIVGSRKGSSSIPLARRPAKWALGRLASLLSGRDIPDINSGMRIFKKSVYRRYRFLLPDGFSFTTTITMAHFAGGYRVEYLPIEYRPRIGRSKIRPIADTLDFIALILRTAMYFNPMKVFFPLGAGLAALGGVWGLIGILLNGNLSDVPALFMVAGVQIVALGLLADLILRKLYDLEERAEASDRSTSKTD